MTTSFKDIAYVSGAGRQRPDFKAEVISLKEKKTFQLILQIVLHFFIDFKVNKFFSAVN